MIKNEWKNGVQFLLKGMHHCLGEQMSGFRACKTLQDQTRDQEHSELLERRSSDLADYAFVWQNIPVN